MSNELVVFSALLARLAGFFLLSPLFAKRNIPIWARLGLTLCCSLLLLPPLSTQLTLPEHPLLFSAELVKECAIGYLLGFLFSLLFEAAAFAGQVVGVLTGFSATELLDPLSNSGHPLISRLFALTLFALFLALDLHHPLLRLLYESYTIFPTAAASSVIEASGRLFTHALSYALFPMTLLLFVIVCFAIVSRFFPALQIFWNGFPIQLLIGFGTLAFAVGFFGHILQGAFNEFWAVVNAFFTRS